MTTLAPCLTASIARASPIPVLAPVTQTTCKLIFALQNNLAHLRLKTLMTRCILAWGSLRLGIRNWKQNLIFEASVQAGAQSFPNQGGKIRVSSVEKFVFIFVTSITLYSSVVQLCRWHLIQTTRRRANAITRRSAVIMRRSIVNSVNICNENKNQIIITGLFPPN